MHNNKETLNYIKIVFDYLINAFGSKSYGDDFDVEGGFAFKSNQYTNEGTFVLRVTNINPDGSIKKNNLDKFVNNKELINDLKNYVLKENDILIVMVGGSLGKVGKVTKEILPALLNQNLWKINNAKKINSDYLFYLSLYLNEFKASIKTSSFGHFSRKKYRDLEIPDVKIEQSELIASFLNELCIKKNIIDLDILNPIRKILSRLIIFDKNKLEISSELTHQQNLIKQLRQAFLREAMQGKLVKSTNTKETGEQLLAKIKAEKAQLIAEKKIKSGKLQQAEVLEGLHFEIPEHWVWCNLDDICFNITDGTHQTPIYTTSGRMFLSAQNVKPFRFIPEKHKYVSEEDYQIYIRNRKPEKGDLLIGRVGAGIGETAVIDQDLDFCIYVSVALVQPFKEHVNSDYLSQVFNSPYGVRYSKGNISSKGGSAGNFNLGRIRSFKIPLPPLHEQKQIVTKLEELMVFCDSLEQSIKESQGFNEKLLQQVLREALQGEKV